MTEFDSISKIHRAYDEKRISPTELTQEYLGFCRKSDLNAFITLTEERVLSQAKEADAVLSKEGSVPRDQKPLFGIPLGIKDVLTIEGVRTTSASRILSNYIPPYTATAVSRLENAGALTLGKLNMDEFAMGASNENSAFGNVKHPTFPDRVPGGSSGGSAAAVKAGLCVAALGTDTGGSIRLPASFCGVFGIKPTYGRVSRHGLIAFASSLDQIGPLARTVEDAAVLLGLMSGSDPLDSTSAPVEPLRWQNSLQKSLQEKIDWSKVRIGVPEEYFTDGVESDIAVSIESALKWYEEQGATRVSVSLPQTKYAIASYYLVAVSEASSNLARYDGVRFGVRPETVQSGEEGRDLVSFYESVRSQFGAEVKRRVLLGTFALSSGYYDAYYQRACRVRRLIKEEFDRVFKEVDVLMAPIAPFTAFKAGGEKTRDPLKMYLVDAYTAPGSLAGLPALSIPCGEDREGLPIGLQMMGPHFSEELLLRLAHAFERREAV